MYATHSTEARVERFLRDEGATTAFLGTLCSIRGIRGASQTRLSTMQRGKSLEHDTAKALDGLISKLDALRDALKPIPIRFENAADINDLLESMDAGSLYALVIDSLVTREEQR